MTPRNSRFIQRSRIDIIACILHNSEGSSRKTRLIYRCNLSVSQFNKYVRCLLEGGLLQRAEKNRVITYNTTKLGMDFLQDYEKIKKILDKMRI